MKAIRFTQYGAPDVLQLTDVEKPTPNPDQVLVKVHAASVNAVDWHSLTADIFLVRFGNGLLKPKDPSLGVDFAGVVEAVGSNVKDFKVGDEVFGGRSGAFSEYVCVKNAIALKPKNMTFEQAAAVPVAAVTALQGLRDQGKIQAGQKVLINGASGGVGIFAVQLAKHFGAHVTAVCSTRNVEMVRTLGADVVIDYKREDFTKNGQQYDLILPVNGYQPIMQYRRSLTPNGRCIYAGGKTPQIFEGMLLSPVISLFGGKKMSTFLAQLNRQDLNVLKDIIEAGKLVSVIDKQYPLSETRQAMRDFGEGHTKGKLVIAVA